MKLVVIESPYSGDVVRNIVYARACTLDSFRRGEAPIASHLLYTQDGILHDRDPEERKLGIEAGFAWGERAELCAVYINFGLTDGMKMGIEHAAKIGLHVEERLLPPEMIMRVLQIASFMKQNGVTEHTIWSGGQDLRFYTKMLEIEL